MIFVPENYRFWCLHWNWTRHRILASLGSCLLGNSIMRWNLTCGIFWPIRSRLVCSVFPCCRPCCAVLCRGGLGSLSVSIISPHIFILSSCNFILTIRLDLFAEDCFFITFLGCVGINNVAGFIRKVRIEWIFWCSCISNEY